MRAIEHVREDVASVAVTVQVPDVASSAWLEMPRSAGVGFLAGSAYGATSVIVGQPLDTIKTRMQARPDSIKTGPMRVAVELARSQGVQGLYRGGTPVLLGGTLFRSAQFGFYELALKQLREKTPSYRVFGVLDWQIAVAGIAGGLARGVIEAPFDLVKVSQQVEQKWTVGTLYKGSTITLVRNSALFCAFSIYRDIVPPLIPGGLSPFWMGALSSNLAWLTIWPLDVIKSQRQSGNFPHHSSWALLVDAARGGLLFRGLMPGLARSTLANGSAMVVYKKVEEWGNVEVPKWR
ncbi:unnamed protein product [Polarella glacialis]|uniref:Mitochondrial carrier protein n=1 Tax=Polarella glacialis TaxID=89957 RepID=A0A813FUT0_POLGL|nr:unnamed protein product [Polarella glacialis]CAE8616041.1 unnamed protein product [Polarella glacialis]CAE8734377.1 unnamed protein product [Polarella glacialis]|mmetsp:Transcript_80907/g.146020  ORF Transcript_80907/g.146020 Transcript_80907/m.146020 type:complete len:293 (+) Transcript_80907:80-958(+)